MTTPTPETAICKCPAGFCKCSHSHVTTMNPKDVPDEWVKAAMDKHPVREIRSVIAAVWPLIAAAERAKVAEEILRNSRGTPVWQAAMEEAAEIALGEPT